MTVTDIRPHITPHPEPTLESRRAESLRAVLDDPDLSGWHEQARTALAELVALTATSALAA